MTPINFENGAPVYTSEGVLFGAVKKVSETDVLVTDNGREVSIPRSAFDVDQSRHDRLVLSASVDPGARDTGTPIPRHAEELSVHVNEVDQGKLRIHKSVEHFPVQQDVDLESDVVDVERVPSGEVFDEMPEQWQDGDTLVIPVVEDVLVLTRRYRVVENIRVTKRRESRTERVEAALRREVVSFHQEDADGNPIES